jgi:hypothetical protein
MLEYNYTIRLIKDQTVEIMQTRELLIIQMQGIHLQNLANSSNYTENNQCIK